MLMQILRHVNFEAVNHGGTINVQLEPAQSYLIRASSKHGVHLGEGCVAHACGGASWVGGTSFHGWVVCEADSRQEMKGGPLHSEVPEPDSALQFTADTIHIHRKSWRDSLRDRLLSKSH